MQHMSPAVIRLPHFSLYRGPWPWEHFTPEELSDFETGELVVVPAFLDWLESVRVDVNEWMTVNDGTRSKARQIRKSGSPVGAHPDGEAVDIRCHGYLAYKIQKVALARDVSGIGVYQSPDRPHKKRFVHLDRWTKAPPGLRPRLWSG
jgi:hypothetical protein